ncbi:hypothetical protein FSP39_018666 [Pinctada imbricata]|uniref:Uncharacterized protein n=1 Tax=Pinctada imbricata TaxID=66713 RepID=A0AA88XLG9_PINIB|nr:hypothetical protein FSP39_018666 [Pinctada imbricata]
MAAFRNVFKADKLRHKKCDRMLDLKHKEKNSKQIESHRMFQVGNHLKGKFFHRKKMSTKTTTDMEIEIPTFKLLEISR